MKRTAYILITFAVVLSASCTKYLDIKPYGEVIPKTADEFASLLHSILEDIDYGESYIIGDGQSISRAIVTISTRISRLIRTETAEPYTSGTTFPASRRCIPIFTAP